MTGQASGDAISMPGSHSIGGPVRAVLILLGFAALTLPLMPVQYVLLRVAPGAARRLPHWYHRQVCRLVGVRLQVEGAIAEGLPVLVVANHVSWLDIPVLSAVAPVSFIAKKEVGSWPFVSWLARLQRTVFVDRERRTSVGHTASEMGERLAAGDTLVVFAEGTSTDGNRVMPFRTALFAAAYAVPERDLAVQTLSLTYTRLHGVPLGRVGRKMVGWYGDMGMGGHAWELLKAGPLDVRIVIGPPMALADFGDRKALAAHTEAAVRRDVVASLRGRD